MSSFHPLRVQFLFTVARFLCRPPGPEFRENSRERGRRSPENRSQGLRPPWGVHASPRRSGGAGRGGSPRGDGTPGGGAFSGQASVVRGVPSGAKRAGSRARRGRRAGKSRAAGAKAGGFAGKRRTAGAFRAAAGAQCRAETGKTGRLRRGNGGFRRGFTGKAAGRRGENGGFRGCGRQKGAKKAPRRRGSGGKRGVARHTPDGV